MKKKGTYFLTGFIAVIGVAYLMVAISKPEFSYTPSGDSVINKEVEEALPLVELIHNNEGETPEEDLVKFGKEMFYEETFGNEVFFTDIMGAYDGAFTIPYIGKAVMKLEGKGTSNLQVEAAETFNIGGRKIEKGSLIDTGLDVAKGSIMPIGIKVKATGTGMKAGISCALCHASVDQDHNVIQGIPNSDLNIGLLLAMATNSAAYFTHTEMESLRDFITETERQVVTSGGKKESLPDPEALEQFVDEQVSQWPPGSNDTTIDFKNNPVQIPDSFTLGDHPYGWSGQGLIGPFNGLSAAINNAHSQNMDSLSQSEISKPVLGIDKEVYLGTILQKAANTKYQYDPSQGEKPSEFFKKVDPTPGNPGVNTLIKATTYPKISYMTSIGMLSSKEGFHAWEQIDGMSAFMNALEPPETPIQKDVDKVNSGREVFEKAGCITCHAGNYLTNNHLIPVEEIGTEPSRAKGFKKTEEYFSEPSTYAPGTNVPLPEDPKIISVPLNDYQKEQLQMAWAHGDSKGGYKIPSLYGLYWSAPYLHDGGVAVGKNISSDVGVLNTLIKGKKADPVNSLHALFDQNLREKVVKLNKENKDRITTRVTGEGHHYWVDESTGFSKEEREALIHYLLTLTDNK